MSTNGGSTELHGIVPSLVTPFGGGGAVDLGALRALARFAADAGADGVMVCALAGEAAELDAEERRRCVAATVEEVGDRLPVVAGVGAAGKAAASALARDAEAEGAACVVISLLDGGHPESRDLEGFLAGVAGEVSIAAIVQDAPTYLEAELGVEAVLAAAQEAPNIRHLKAEGGSLAVEAAVARADGELALWGGDAGVHLLDCLRCGAAGVMPGVEVIDLLAEVRELEWAGRADEADARMRALLPLLVYEMQSLPHYVACAKYVLRRRGHPVRSAVRIAGGRLSERSEELLERHLVNTQGER
jgi:4-hydroxy-tetrahydrodipicolinate synthase